MTPLFVILGLFGLGIFSVYMAIKTYKQKKALSSPPTDRPLIKTNIPKSKPRKSLEICFTGFPESEKAGLYESAEAYGLTVRKDVTKYLDILCCGDSPGPVKVRKATEKGCMILSLEELITMLETGEVPDVGWFEER
jgi:NAD-dependent DNA ligase